MTQIIVQPEKHQHIVSCIGILSSKHTLMKKILIPFDGQHFSKGAFDYACQINETQPILLTGVFLPSVDYTDVMIYYLGGNAGPLYLPSVDTDAESIEQNIEQFKELCIKNNIEFRVHTTISGSVSEGIKKETRYADIMILSSESFYSNLGKATQADYLTDTMHKAECPIIVVPEEYTRPQSIILAYDGSKSSVFAIKQFAYLFPELADTNTLVVYASEKEGKFPDLSYIEELAARHFRDLTFFKLEADPKKYFNTWITDKGAALLVTGAFDRNSVSEFFKRPFAHEIINEHKLPVFIAHP